MKIKLFSIFIAIMLILIGCSHNDSKYIDDFNVINEENEYADFEEVKDNINNDKVIEETDEIQEVKEYFGEVYGNSTNRRVYEVKDNNSKVIHTAKSEEKIRLLQVIPYGWYKVELKNGEIGYMDARGIRTEEIPPHEYTKNVEGYALIFDHKNQKLRIYKDGELIKECLGSSGTWDTPTPKGIFEIEKGRRGKWSYTERYASGFKYWVGFKHIYLFHSIIYDKDQNIIEEELAKLGQPASHGCIRLPVEIAKFIYDEVPAGSLVIIE